MKLSDVKINEDLPVGCRLYRVNLLIEGATWDSCIYCIYAYPPGGLKKWLESLDDVAQVRNITELEVY